MKTVFADACYYFALLMEQDQYAGSGQDFTSALTGRFVTTTAVLTEVDNSFAHGRRYVALVRFVGHLHAQRVAIEVVHASEQRMGPGKSSLSRSSR